MGLLEDAIREHLELKRLRGADPAEVAREQHEVLDTPAGAGSEAGAPHEAAAASEADGAAQVPQEPAVDEDVSAPAAPDAGEFPGVGDETAEIDMEAVLAQHPPPAGDPGDPPELAQGRMPPDMTEEDSLEWEVPARSHDADPSGPLGEEARGDGGAEHQRHEGDAEEERRLGTEDNVPGQGRLSF
ncbi:MAG TPA: hypothetical protein VGO14_01840 [Solirubrobacteraceae bacterium]|jgi:hypothetical protein|nr:hypothetical protein [Solirubrobacteraceae bacterium]